MFCSASWRAVPMTSSISGAKVHRLRASSSLPASILERSSTWLMRPSRWVPAPWTRRSGSYRFFRAEARRVADHHLGQPDDRVERRAQLVAHAGDELRLVLARHLRAAGSCPRSPSNRRAFWIASTDWAAKVFSRSIVLRRGTGPAPCAGHHQGADQLARIRKQRHHQESPVAGTQDDLLQRRGWRFVQVRDLDRARAFRSARPTADARARHAWLATPAINSSLMP